MVILISFLLHLQRLSRHCEFGELMRCEIIVDILFPI